MAIALIPAGPPAAAVVPNLSGQWGRDMLFFEPPASGPGPVVIARPNPDGSLAPQMPCCSVVQSWFGDPNNPILKPEAAEAVRRIANLSREGTVIEDAHSLCRPEPPPYVLGMHYGVLIIQKRTEVDLFYLLYNTVRRVRINAFHPRKLTPSWAGDSVGHYEGDALVIDTIGVKASPQSTVDAFGTPVTAALHVVERYRLIDGAAATEAQEKNGGKPSTAPPFGRGLIDPDKSKMGLEVAFTVEDPNVFTTRWSARVTYRPVQGVWPEAVCQENPREYYAGRNADIPAAAVPDF